MCFRSWFCSELNFHDNCLLVGSEDAADLTSSAWLSKNTRMAVIVAAKTCPFCHFQDDEQKL